MSVLCMPRQRVNAGKCGFEGEGEQEEAKKKKEPIDGLKRGLFMLFFKKSGSK